MSARKLLVSLAAISVLFGSWCATAEGQLGKRHHRRFRVIYVQDSPAQSHVQLTYPVADLVVPINWDGDPVPPTKTIEDELIRLICSTVAPASWSQNGGTGSIQYYPLGMALVINNTREVNEEVVALLAALRRLLDINVSAEIRMFTLADAALQRIPAQLGLAKCLENAGKGGPIVLNDDQVFQLLQAAQGDRRTNVMQMPKVTMFNGQRVPIFVGDQRFFVTDIEVAKENDQVVVRPKNECTPLGVACRLRPVVSADRASVSLEFRFKATSLDGEPPLHPVVMAIKGLDGKEMPLNLHVQKPRITTLAVEQTLTIPAGHTAVLFAGRYEAEERDEVEPALVSWSSLLSRLFTYVKLSKTPTNFFVMVTPRVIDCGAQEQGAICTGQIVRSPRP